MRVGVVEREVDAELMLGGLDDVARAAEIEPVVERQMGTVVGGVLTDHLAVEDIRLFGLGIGYTGSQHEHRAYVPPLGETGVEHHLEIMPSFSGGVIAIVVKALECGQTAPCPAERVTDVAGDDTRITLEHDVQAVVTSLTGHDIIIESEALIEYLQHVAGRFGDVEDLLEIEFTGHAVLLMVERTDVLETQGMRHFGFELLGRQIEEIGRQSSAGQAGLMVILVVTPVMEGERVIGCRRKMERHTRIDPTEEMSLMMIAAQVQSGVIREPGTHLMPQVGTQGKLVAVGYRVDSLVRAEHRDTGQSERERLVDIMHIIERSGEEQIVAQRVLEAVLETCRRKTLVGMDVCRIDRRRDLVVEGRVISDRAPQTAVEGVRPRDGTDDVLPRECEVSRRIEREETHLIAAVEAGDEQLVAIGELTEVGQVKIHEMIPERIIVHLHELTVEPVDIGRAGREPQGMFLTHGDGEGDIRVDDADVTGEAEAFGLGVERTHIDPSAYAVVHRAGVLGGLQRDRAEMRTDESGEQPHEVIRIIDRCLVDRDERLIIVAPVYPQTGGHLVIGLDARQALEVPDRIGRTEELRHEGYMLHIDHHAFGTLLDEGHRAGLHHLDILQLLDDSDTTAISSSLPENGQTATEQKYHYQQKDHQK